MRLAATTGGDDVGSWSLCVLFAGRNAAKTDIKSSHVERTALEVSYYEQSGSLIHSI